MVLDVSWFEKEKLMNFINLLQKNNFQRLSYTLSGDIPSENLGWGLSNYVFATKILYISKLLRHLDSVQKQNLVNGILKYTQANNYIYDPFITKNSFKFFVMKFLKGEYKDAITKITDIRRAETRQSFAALYLLKSKPVGEFSDLPQNIREIDNFLTKYDWSLPWHAGSHFSHLLFFLKTNEHFFHSRNNAHLISHAVNWISSIQNPIDGCWYTGTNVSLKEKINGAMKVLTGLHAAGIYTINYAEKLIDTCLTASNDEEACSNFNVVYVLYGATRINSHYRSKEIYKFLQNRLDLYRQYYHPEIGGFSFFKEGVNTHYYGKEVAYGRYEPDIHGTALFIWGLAIINSIYKINLDLAVPLN